MTCFMIDSYRLSWESGGLIHTVFLLETNKISQVFDRYEDDINPT